MFIKNQLHPKLNEIVMKADSLRKKTVDQLAQANDAFNEGKIADVFSLNKLKKEWLFQQNNEMAKLRASYFDMVDQVKSELMAQAFAPLPSERAEFRGVYAGLQQVTEKAQIERAYSDAIRFNDFPAMKAAVCRACDLGVDAVVNNYKARDNNFAKNADALSEFTAGAGDITAKFAAKARLTAIREPHLNQQDKPFGHTTDSQGNQTTVTRPYFYYEDHEAPKGEMHPGATGDTA